MIDSRAFSLCVVASLLSACASMSSDEPTPEPAVQIELDAEEPIGKFLADADRLIERWTIVSVQAHTPELRREERMLVQVLSDRSLRRRDELIRELELGPPINRMRAATALGFTKSVEAQSPLLNALSDANPDVVHNAVLGLAILARADTPLDKLCQLSEFDPDPQTRGQAAFAVRAIVNAGGSGECALGAARRGLADPEVYVRSQSVLTLGLLGDTESVPAMCDLIHDPSMHVTSAALEALLLVVDKNDMQKGPVGRALVEAYAGTKKQRKDMIKQTLINLSDVNYGEDVVLWTEWSQRLP